MSATTYTGPPADETPDMPTRSDDDGCNAMPGRGHFDLFVMPSSWTRDPRLSFATLGFLTRLKDRLQDVERGETVSLDHLSTAADEPGHARQIAAELRQLGYIVGGRLVDPFAEAAEQRRRADHPEWYVPRQAGPVQSPDLVYYIRRSDGAVKIGHSTNVRARMKGLVREHGELKLLATEPGGKGMEDQRHDEFAELRLPDDRTCGGTEWFRLEGALADHVSALGVAA